MDPQKSHTDRQWQGKFFRCGMRCFYCLKPLSLIPPSAGTYAEIATQDHLTPRSRGGSDAIDNIVPACFDCNRRKGDMTETEFRAAIHRAFQSATKGVAIAGSALSLSARDEPSENVLRKESESVSWAWRHPA